jgi:two-component system chemotaxis sensor kinase CheA
VSDDEAELDMFREESTRIVDDFARMLGEYRAGAADGDGDPDLLNRAYRAVHGLKGFAGAFGASAVGRLSQGLERALDDMRLGRRARSPEVFAALSDAVAMFGRLLAPAGEGVDIEPLLVQLRTVGELPPSDEPRESIAWVGASIVEAVTQYEEHRLRENLRAGRSLYRVHAVFTAETIDTGVERLGEKMRPWGEAITYVPSPDEAPDDGIVIDVVLGSHAGLAEISAALGDRDVSVHRIERGEAT